ncbi:MAG: NfeD family protein [Formivibrio sp.]|nr:NfeD family protein [Formivibrio sp.]
MSISPATLWLILALVLAGLEMLSGTFYLLALAIGLACGALTAWLTLPIPVQTSVAAVVSVIAAILLRRWKTKNIPQSAETSLDIGQRVRIIEWQTKTQARVQYRGTQWDAELATSAESGHAEYFITAVRGSTLVLHQNPPEQN